MEEKEFQMSEKELQRMYTKIMTDDTRWDLMTGAELNKRIKAYITTHVDDQMVEGIEFKDLDPITFERFGGKRIKCKTSYGRELIGEANMFHEDDILGPCLTVDTEDNESIELYFNQVETIKDITDYGEPDEE